MNKTKVLNIRFDEMELDRLQLICSKSRCNMSDFIRAAIDEKIYKVLESADLQKVTLDTQ